jgi:hypothetical protein
MNDMRHDTNGNYPNTDPHIKNFFTDVSEGLAETRDVLPNLVKTAIDAGRIPGDLI